LTFTFGFYRATSNNAQIIKDRMTGDIFTCPSDGIIFKIEARITRLVYPRNVKLLCYEWVSDSEMGALVAETETRLLAAGTTYESFDVAGGPLAVTSGSKYFLMGWSTGGGTNCAYIACRWDAPYTSTCKYKAQVGFPNEPDPGGAANTTNMDPIILATCYDVVDDSEDLPCGFNVGQGSVNLAAQFEVGQGSEDLPAEFEVGQNTVDLLGEFVVRHVGTPVDLLGEFIVRQERSVELPGEFIVRQETSRDLLGGFIVRHERSVDLAGEFVIQHSASQDLPAEFVVKQWAVDLLGVFVVYQHYGNEFRATSGSSRIFTAVGQKYAFRFTAQDSKTVKEIAVRHESVSGQTYKFKVGLQGDNGGDPDGVWINNCKVEYDQGGVSPGQGWNWHVLSNTVALTKFTVYHVVIEATEVTNTFSFRGTTPENRFIPGRLVPSGAMQLFDARLDARYYNGAVWSSESRTVVFALKYTDNELFGQPYDHNWPTTRIHGATVQYQTIVPSKTITIKSIGAYVRKQGAPADSLYVSLRHSNGSIIYREVTIPAAEVGAVYAWEDKSINIFTLKKGITYRLYWTSPGSSAANYYEAIHPYNSDAAVSDFHPLTWGGIVSTWSVPATWPGHDMTFRFSQTSDRSWDDLPAEFIVRQETSVDLPAEFIVRQETSVDLPAEFIIRQERAEDLLGEFTVRHTGIPVNLLCNFTVRHVGTPVDLLGEFIVRQDTSVDLLGEFIICHEISADLLGEFVIRRSASVDLSAQFEVGQDSADLLSIFVIRRSASVELPARFIIRRSAALNLPAEFITQHTATADLPAGFWVNYYSVDLFAKFNVRQTSSRATDFEIIDTTRGLTIPDADREMTVTPRRRMRVK